ncbi:hypothetical protein SCUCBS95973_000940 [Sporothrix curviconia]|uniref:Uncharacterized protein n=1 Tax=Sporothrix curviconia TaxID=1260050 RepID=A0ABP0AUS2_9PEZI
MAPPRVWALAIALAVPLVSASPVGPRDGQGLWPPPTPTWWFPGPPSSTVTVSPINPGGPLIPDPGNPGGSPSPDPVVPGGPIEADPTTPGGDLNPDDPSYGSYGDDGSSTTLKAGRAVAAGAQDGAPGPILGFGLPANPVITANPVIPAGPFNTERGDGNNGFLLPPGDLIPSGPMRPALLPNQAVVPAPPEHNDRSVNIPAQSNSAAAAAPSPPPTTVAAAACTFTIRAPHVLNPCAWNGYVTVYTATATATQTIDCQGCTAVHIQNRLYACPMHPAFPVTTAATPATQYAAVCSATPTAAVAPL